MAGMFRGNCATLLKVVPQTAIQFAVSGLHAYARDKAAAPCTP